MIRVEGVEKSFHGEPILRDIHLEIPKQTVLGVIGASGSGKTTLMRCINGLTRFDKGRVSCGEAILSADLSEGEYEIQLSSLRRRVGMVFQHLYLFPHLRALQNATEAPIRVHKRPKLQAEAEALDWLEKFGISHAAHRYPEEMSGGEQQRLAIIRALMMRPDVLFMDEPTSALDPQRSSDVRSILRSFVDRGHTLVIVSHSIGFLKGLADRILYMERGSVVEYGEADQVFYSPKEERTRSFLEHA